jgi:hypothetical protein
MKSTHDSKIIRITAAQLKPPTARDVDRLRKAAMMPIDTSEIPEVRISRRPKGPIWHAVVDEMRRQGLTGHRLWKMARPFCSKIPESAVYEFLSNRRSVRVEYADAMLQALGIRFLSTRRRRAG